MTRVPTWCQVQQKQQQQQNDCKNRNAKVRRPTHHQQQQQQNNNQHCQSENANVKMKQTRNSTHSFKYSAFYLIQGLFQSRESRHMLGQADIKRTQKGQTDASNEH